MEKQNPGVEKAESGQCNSRSWIQKQQKVVGDRADAVYKEQKTDIGIAETGCEKSR